MGSTQKHTTKDFDPFSGFFHGKRILVTGDTGFKGSWLALWLHQLGAEITGIGLPPHTTPSHYDLAGISKKIRHIDLDIRDEKEMLECFSFTKPEIVFHLAAQALVRDSYADPKTTFDTNVGGTVNALEAIRHCESVRAGVVVTSDKCYENKEWAWGYRENDSLGGHDPYSASKGAAEIVVAAYRTSYFSKNGMGPHVGLATARTGNVIGGGDWAADRIIPDCVRALQNNVPVLIRNPRSTRPWQHVLDPLYGYLSLAKHLWMDPQRYEGAWNFGPSASSHTSVSELANHFVSIWGSGSLEFVKEEKPLKEAHYLHLNIDKSTSELKWHPVLDSSTAIGWTAEWYKTWHLNDSECLNASIKQIQQFSKKVSPI